MRYRLRTLLIVLALGPLVVAWGYREVEDYLVRLHQNTDSSIRAYDARILVRPCSAPADWRGDGIDPLFPPPYVTAGITDVATMVKVVSAKAPAGSAIKDARRFMEQEGFTCNYTKGGWSDERGEYLYCDRQDKESAFVNRVWKVAIFHRDGKVVKVAANTGLVGP